MATSNFSMRMDENLKSQLQELVSDLGLDLTTFFTLAAKQAVREQAIPFKISKNIFNAETIAAINETEEMKKNPVAHKTYSSFSELLEEVENEI